MQRVASRQSIPALHEALRLIPKPVHPLLRCDYLLGVDPIAIGLHHYEDTDDGRSYRETAHVFHAEFHQVADRRTTVVIPVEETPETFVHELAHVLDGSIGWAWRIDPVCDYAATNDQEAFACAFTAFILPGLDPDVRPLSNDEWLLFDSICRGNQP